MASERDYPFDPTLSPSAQVGLDRLRCIEDRGTAGLLYRLFYQLAPDVATSETFDPSTYGDEIEPDLSQLHDPVGARAHEQDMSNAAIHFAWKEFWRKMETYEQERGRRLSAQQRAKHVYEFGGILERAYGRAQTTPTWEARHREWEDRVVTRGGSFGGGQ